MKNFYVRIILIHLLLLCSFILLIEYELFKPIRKILGLHCDGWGCWGMGIVYSIIIFILIPIIVSIIGYFLAPEQKWRKAFEALGIAIILMIIFSVTQSIWNNINLRKEIHEAEIAEEKFRIEVKQNEEIIKNDKLEEDKNLKQVIELSQTKIVDKKLGSEFLATGVVVDHNLEDVNILGGYVQIKLDINKRDAFVIYNPYVNGKQSDCENRINPKIFVGDNVEIRGVVIKELNFVEPTEMLISTCESQDYYIKKI